MKIALVGYGAMGHLIAEEVSKAGDELGCVLNSDSVELGVAQLADRLRGHDVAIDFSVSEAVLNTSEACALAGVALVEGTTGWNQSEPAVRELVQRYDGALVYGANFSIGVNLFYRIVSYASELFAAVDSYKPFIEEAHHSRKRDAPSGTALRLHEFMSEHLKSDIPTSSTRAGFIPGTHRVGFDSEADQILLMHEARSRQGFAAGALVAAHWIKGRKGVYEFEKVIEEILQPINSNEF